MFNMPIMAPKLKISYNIERVEQFIPNSICRKPSPIMLKLSPPYFTVAMMHFRAYTLFGFHHTEFFIIVAQ